MHCTTLKAMAISGAVIMPLLLHSGPTALLHALANPLTNLVGNVGKCIEENRSRHGLPIASFCCKHASPDQGH
jgi:hypothetical protein